MSGSVLVPWDEAVLGYDLGPEHPLNPLRLDLTMRLARDLGVLDLPAVRMVRPEPATDELIGLVHDADYIAAVTWWALALSFGVSALVGIVFGVVPAQRAGRLDPVVALRTE